MQPVEADHVVATLRASRMLAEVSGEELLAVADEFSHRHADAGELLLVQGTVSEGFGFVIDGQVALRIGGREHTRLARGEAFGEISALLDEPVSGDLVALGPVGYIWLERERVRDFLIRHPELCYGMLQGEARRLRDPGRWYSSVSARTRGGRLDARQLAHAPGRAAARMAERHGARAGSGGAARAAAARLRRRGADAAARARRGRRGARVPAAGRRLRRVLQRPEHRRGAQPAARPAADGDRPHVRIGQPHRQGRADGRAVRQAAIGVGGGRRRRRAAGLPRRHGELRRARSGEPRHRTRSACSPPTTTQRRS